MSGIDTYDCVIEGAMKQSGSGEAGEWVAYDEHQSAIDRLTADSNDLHALLDALQVRHRAVMAERDAAVADAERWKFARDNAPVIESAGGLFRVRGLLSWHPTKDMAIDAAMKEQEQGK